MRAQFLLCSLVRALRHRRRPHVLRVRVVNFSFRLIKRAREGERETERSVMELLLLVCLVFRSE